MRYSKRRNSVQQPESESMTTFDAALQAFLDGQDAAGHSKVSRSDYKRVVNLFLRHLTEKYQYTFI